MADGAGSLAEKRRGSLEMVEAAIVQPAEKELHRALAEEYHRRSGQPVRSLPPPPSSRQNSLG